MALTSVSVRRSAAVRAICCSMTCRKSSSDSTSCHSLLSVRRIISADSGPQPDVTNVPPDRPRRTVTYPASASRAIASRTVARLTLSIAASSRSVGSRCPGTNWPSAIAVTNRSAIRSPVVRTIIGLSTPCDAGVSRSAPFGAGRPPPAPSAPPPPVSAPLPAGSARPAGHNALPSGSPPPA